ncbi:MAG TPA: sigma-54 dependent transcriptional regulator [Bdellovibrionota bacterium]|jgi:two-component system response regulator HydG|nr:sigma-54 dependent transcriptional regulator [Bdellovibrionota bacterium]
MILIVDDEAPNREALRLLLERSGWECFEAESGTRALEILKTDPKVRLLITDLKMPEMNGIELLQIARHIRPEVQRLLVTAFGTIEDTVSAMKLGAFDVLTKPLKAAQVREKVEAMLAAAPDVVSTSSSSSVSPAYAKVMDLLRRASQSDASVLLVGESGTGKSYLAETLHSWSRRSEQPFVALNCAAIPAELLESELFGFEKGAFTGATQAREGKILSANHGTLLLDEIGDLSTALQAKLLQFIQDRSFFKLGSNKKISADVRIIAATNRDLAELVSEKKFREDLLYRLRVVEIKMPPLRERKEDLLWLVPSLLDKLCEKNHKAPVRFTQEAMRCLWNHDWPGNIRELENVIETSLVLAPGEVLRSGFLPAESLPDFLRTLPTRDEHLNLNFSDLATLEKRAIDQALTITGGNKKLAASLLGISERTLYRMLKSGDAPPP